MLDVSRSVGRGIRDRMQLPLNVGVSDAGYQAINRSLIGGSIAGLAAQGLNVMTGNPDGSDDINVMAAMAAGAGMGAMSGKLGQMNRNRIAKEQMAKESYMNAMGSMNQMAREGYAETTPGTAGLPRRSMDAGYGMISSSALGSNSPLALPGAVFSNVRTSRNLNPRIDPRIEAMFTPAQIKGGQLVREIPSQVGKDQLIRQSSEFAPTMSAASNLPPLLKQAITPSANHGVPDGIPSGAATIPDLGLGVSNVAKTQVPTEIPGGVEVFTATPETGRLSAAIAGTEAYTVSKTGAGTEIYTGSAATAGTQAYTEPQLGMGKPKAYDSREEALLAKATRDALDGKKKLSQGTELKMTEKRKNKQVAQQMEDLMP